MGYVPFGPFLSAGALVMILAARHVWDGIDAYMNFVKGPSARPVDG
jgi:prepilin signal peptidase PulO-like enzyme (type II secretory pathway)